MLRSSVVASSPRAIGVASALLLAGVAAPASASNINVTVRGRVEYSSPVNGPLAPVNPNQEATISFTIDSDDYVNSTLYPTRGYVISQPTFAMQLGPVTMTLKNPFPGTPYFVLRDNDPAVDGFMLSTNVNDPFGLPTNLNGVFGPFGAGFYVTYDGDTLSSLDVLDALGTYEYDGLTVFYWVVEDGPVEPVGMIFESITLSVAADLDGNGGVDAADLAILLGAWGPCRSCSACPADLDGDCDVDAADLAVLLGAWG